MELSDYVENIYRTPLFVISLHCLTKSSISQGKKAVGLKFHKKGSTVAFIQGCG